MKKLILVILIFAPSLVLFAQNPNEDLEERYKEFKTLELEQIKQGEALENYLWRMRLENKGNGRGAAYEYIDFAQKAIRKWQIALETPEVLFIDMTLLEVVELVKSKTPNDATLDERIEMLKEDLREKIREHIRILSEDIRDLSL